MQENFASISWKFRFLIALLLAFFSLIGFSLGVGYQKDVRPLPENSQVVQNIESEQISEIYVGKVDGRLVVFQKNSNGTYFEGYADTGRDRKGLNLDFSQATEVKKIKEGDLYTFGTDESGKYLYASIVNGGLSSVWKIDLADYSQKEMLSKNINGEERFRAGGAFYISQVVGNFLELSLPGCYACETSPEWGAKLILNSESGGVAWLGDVGDIKIDESAGVVTYRRLAWTEEECEIGFMCDNGKWTIRKTVGSVYNEKLPGDGYYLEIPWEMTY